MKTIPTEFDLNAHIVEIDCKVIPENDCCEISFLNLNYGVITAVKFIAQGFNVFDDCILVNGKEEFTLVLQDIRVEKNARLENYQVKLPDSNMRKIKLRESQICYDDGTVTTYTESNIKKYILLEYQDGDLSEDIRAARKAHYKVDFKYKPTLLDSGWVCGCGRFNSSNQQQCTACGLLMVNVLRLLNADYDDQLVDAYVKKIEKQDALETRRTQMRREKKKKTIITCVFSVLIVSLVLLGIHFSVVSRSPSSDFDEEIKQTYAGVQTNYDSNRDTVEKEDFLSNMALGIRHRLNNDTKDADTMSDEEISRYHTKLVNYELKQISKYSDKIIGDSHFDVIAHNYIRACNMQYNSEVKYGERFSNEIWGLGYRIRSTIITELYEKESLPITEEEVSAYSDGIDSALDPYDPDCVLNAVTDILHNAFIFNGEHQVFLFDPSNNTYTYSIHLKDISKSEYESIMMISHSEMDDDTKNDYFDIKHALNCAGYNPQIICKVLSSDSYRLFEYSNGELIYMYRKEFSASSSNSSSSNSSSSSSSSSNSYSSSSNSYSGSSSSYRSADRSRDAWVCAIKYVEDNLKSPSTAKFCKYTDATVMRVGEDEYIIHGYVDAQNSFGATVRQIWTVSLFLTEKGFRDPYLEWG